MRSATSRGRLGLASSALRIGDYETAEREYRALIAGDPKNFELYMRLGETLRRKGQIQDAIGTLRQGQALAPTDPMANLQLAMLMELAGQKREAFPLYENVIKKDPTNPIALNNVAFMMAEEGRDLDTALTYAQRAKQQMPANDDVSDTLGWIYLKKRLNDNAIVIFKDIVKRNPSTVQYRYHLALAQFNKGDTIAAKQSIQAALALKPSKEEEMQIRELLAKIG